MSEQNMDYGLGFDLDKLVDDVVATGIDQSQAKKGPELPPVGTAFFRIFAVVELGKQKFVPKKGMAEKEGPRIKIGVELSGPKYPARQTDDGLRPITMWLKELTLSQDDRSGYYKLFKQMTKAAPGTRHIVQLVGNRAAFMAEIEHSEDKKYANINMESIRPAVNSNFNPETGETEVTPLKVEALRTKPLVYIWNNASPAMFDSLYIPGHMEAKTDDSGKVIKPARSRNVWQEKIRQALNLDTSPIADYIKGKVSAETLQQLDEEAEPEEVPDGVREAPQDAEVDPMGGIGI